MPPLARSLLQPAGSESDSALSVHTCTPPVTTTPLAYETTVTIPWISRPSHPFSNLSAFLASPSARPVLFTPPTPHTHTHTRAGARTLPRSLMPPCGSRRLLIHLVHVSAKVHGPVPLISREGMAATGCARARVCVHAIRRMSRSPSPS